MEYFKLYLSPDQGRPIAAPSLSCGGGAGLEVAGLYRSRAPSHSPSGSGDPPPSRGPDPLGAHAEMRGSCPPAEIRLPRAWHSARGARRGVKVAGTAELGGRTGTAQGG